MLLIGLSGKLGAGKNYIAEKIVPLVLSELAPGALQIFQMAFGDQMKVELAARDRELTYENLFVEKSQKTRELMQFYGTDLCRRQFGSDVWIRSMDTWISIHKSRIASSGLQPVFVISDVRFENEAGWIQSKGGILIRIDAPDRNRERLEREGGSKADQHPSETDLDNFPFIHRVQNDKNVTPVQLRDQILAILKNVAVL